MSLEDLFPGLRGKPLAVTSPPDVGYNCVAWAAGQPNEWWWPSKDDDAAVWPPGAPWEETLEAFRAVFEILGYVQCGDGDAEPGFEKIAVFATPGGDPQHAARQLASGRWTSKLGKLEDIEHDLRDLEGVAYGTVALLMKRPMPHA